MNSIGRRMVLGLLLAAVLLTAVGAVTWRLHGEDATRVLGIKLQGNGQGNNGSGLGNKPGNPAKDFSLSGQIDGLAPGVTVKLRLNVDNPNNQNIRVTGLTAALQSITKASGAPTGECTVSDSNLRIGPWSGQEFVVPRNSTVSSDPSFIPITMPSTVSDACEGATFNLSYSGTAVQG